MNRFSISSTCFMHFLFPILIYWRQPRAYGGRPGAATKPPNKKPRKSIEASKIAVSHSARLHIPCSVATASGFPGGLRHLAPVSWFSYFSLSRWRQTMQSVWGCLQHPAQKWQGRNLQLLRISSWNGGFHWWRPILLCRTGGPLSDWGLLLLKSISV